ncbi:MAG: radical SAM protein [Oscillospiraceae bacterium]
MSLLTSATRMWLTRRVRPFTFTRDSAPRPYGETERLGLYIHIPFCRTLCAFCPYCKVPFDPALCDGYLDALIREIHLVGGAEPGKKTVTSLYFGGGTPALAIDRLGEVLDAVGAHFVITEGIGLELHPEDVTVENLTRLKALGITKISIGVQSFQPALLALLGRGEADPTALFSALRAVPFETVSMDFIFALPGQTFPQLQADIETAFANGANHIAIYPFIDFSFADSGIPAMGKEEKHRLLDEITDYCASMGYGRESIWTFSKERGAGYSSMTRENFLGFGCSATTLLRDSFQINTFSIGEYEKKIDGGTLPTALTLHFTKRQRMIYYLFWTAYSTRVERGAFAAFFGEPLGKNYGAELWLAKRLGFATEADGVITLTKRGAFAYHYYENYYTLAYIDKMWGILRREAFPEKIEL